MSTLPPRPAIGRPRPRRRALLALAWAAPMLLVLSQLRLLPQDQGVLLELAGMPVDAAGRLQGAWQRMARDCTAVQRWPAGSASWLAAQQALAGHSPPSSQGARPLQVLQQGDWLLAEVVWDGTGAPPAGGAAGPVIAPLDPAVVALRRVAGGLQVQTEGVWSGDTGPWAAPVFIRRWLQQQVPGLPVGLVLCLDPQWPVFAR